MNSLALLLRLSLRNLLRHSRRNALMLAAITFAIATVVFMNALVRGMQHDLSESTVNNLTGHIQVHAPGYLDDPSIERGFEMTQTLALADIAGDQLAGWAARIRVPAVIMSERETRGIQLVGVDPAQETISFLGRAAYQGKPLANSRDRGIVIGQALADQLKTKVGRRLVIISQGIDGANREAGFRILGTYDVEGSSLEKAFVFTGRERLQAFLDAQLVTEVSVRLKQEPQNWSLQQALGDTFGGLEVRNWQQLEPQAAAMFLMADTAIYIWFLILMSALTFGLVNTLVTAVMERIRELGMLRALGMRPAQVVLQVVLESSVLMLVGVLLGCVLGVGFIFLLSDGIDLSAWAEGVQSFGMRSTLVPLLRMADIWLVSGMSLGLGVLASLYPAIRAVKLSPLEALHR